LKIIFVVVNDIKIFILFLDKVLFLFSFKKKRKERERRESK